MKDVSEDTLAERVVDFLNAVNGGNDCIEPCPDGGFQIYTRIGSSFDLEIAGPTKLETALQYFEHCCGVLHHVSKHKDSLLTYLLSRIGLASYSTRKERLQTEQCLARIRNWADVNLIHLYRARPTLISPK